MRQSSEALWALLAQLDDWAKDSGRGAAQFLLHAFQLLTECLVAHVGAFTPWFAFRFRLRRIGGHFAAIYILETLGLALEFCAQFFFCHMQYLN